VVVEALPRVPNGKFDLRACVRLLGITQPS
jgi:hypothetical protein